MKDKSFSILFTGDLAPIGDAESMPGKPYSLQISNSIKILFDKFDLNITNLEAPLTLSSKKIVKTGPNIKAHPESVKILTDLNINIACLSNNHIRDFGNKGVIDTINICKSNNIRIVGAGANIEESSKPLIINVKGWNVAILNFSENEYNTATATRAGSNPDDPIHIWRSMTSAKDIADFIIVVLHGGKELYPYPTPAQLKLYRFIVELGADAVIGHHTHVIGGYEIYSGTPIVYSLGNFIFDEAGNPPEWYKGALSGISFKAKGGFELEFFLTSQDNKTLSVIDNQIIKPKEVGKDFIHPINDDIVKDEWEKIIKTQSLSTLKGLLHWNLIQRAMLKIGLKRVTQQDLRYLMALGNRFRCNTHRIFTTDVINFLTNSE